MIIWRIVFSFGAFFAVLVSCTKKNLATLRDLLILFPAGKFCRSISLRFFRTQSPTSNCTFRFIVVGEKTAISR
jgi:hypothetical protein